ncbi:MAG: hypothetical protein ACRDJM_10285, partial [Actinomycetota bacterium]
MRSAGRWFPAAALIAAVAASMATAQTPEPGPAATVGVTSFTPWNDPEHSTLSIGLRVRNTGGVPIEDARVRLVLHDRVLSRSALRSALDGRPQ